jgi:hypothetical protein
MTSSEGIACLAQLVETLFQESKKLFKRTETIPRLVMNIFSTEAPNGWFLVIRPEANEISAVRS